ncbi:MAG: hypothetical protein R2713_23645 [Ilumatobacteraceae bacterium]
MTRSRPLTTSSAGRVIRPSSESLMVRVYGWNPTTAFTRSCGATPRAPATVANAV